MTERPLVLVTGVTGYVGSRLVPRLLEAGYRVRVLARDPGRLQGRPWLPEVEVVVGDVFVEETLPNVLGDVDVAYYLIHSMTHSSDFADRDVVAARNFGKAAMEHGVQRIIYLGGLGDPEANLSSHLRSRQDTGETLRDSGVPVTEFRAAIIVGSGSVSFEMIRYLTERLPVMICPRWVSTRVQPIGIDDILSYLVTALEVPESEGEIIEIGGRDILTYGEMMLGYAEVRGLRRYLISVPVLTPNLSSYWIHWVTPIPAEIAHPLIEGLRNEVIVRGDLAARLFPDIHTIGYRTAVQRALAQLEVGGVESSWRDSLSTSQGDASPVSLATIEGMILETRQLEVDASPEHVFTTFTALGGEHGWGFANWAWRIRGWIDRLVGGVGLRRGRRHPQEVRAGDALDFWRVEAVQPNRRMLLRAEMKLPGEAWLEFSVQPQAGGESLLVQTAYFAPRGLFGHLYWYLLYPFHTLIFSGLIRYLARQVEDSSQ